MELSNQTFRKIALLIILAGVVLLTVLHIDVLFSFLGYLWELLSPFAIGFSIAFILNIIITKIENTLLKNIKKNKRVLSFIISMLLLIGVIVLIGFIVGPELVNSIRKIGQQLPASYDQWISLLRDNQDIFGGIFHDAIDNILDSNLDYKVVVNNLSVHWQTLFDSGYMIITETIRILYNGFIAFVFSIYLLLSKESLCRQVRTVSTFALGKERTDDIAHILSMASTTFSNFITGQCLEACILGTMFFISMTILGMPYALLIGVVIAVTALVPIFGAFVGCFIGILLIGISNPMQALGFIVLFLVLQQIEENFIYPHVVGSSVGLPSIWVFVAVILGGSIMGVLGMLIFIPITSIIYTIARTYVRKKKIIIKKSQD